MRLPGDIRNVSAFCGALVLAALTFEYERAYAVADGLFMFAAMGGVYAFWTADRVKNDPLNIRLPFTLFWGVMLIVGLCVLRSFVPVADKALTPSDIETWGSILGPNQPRKEKPLASVTAPTVERHSTAPTPKLMPGLLGVRYNFVDRSHTFDPTRQRHLKLMISRFLRELISVGFDDLPMETPIIDVTTDPGPLAVRVSGTPIFEAHLTFNGNDVDNDAPNVTIGYSRTLFECLLNGIPEPYNSRVAMILGTYFACSLRNSKPHSDTSTDDDKWANVLWEIREYRGPTIANRIAWFVYRTFRNHMSVNETNFNKYFWVRLVSGFTSVESNRFKDSECLFTICRRNGFASVVD